MQSYFSKVYWHFTGGPTIDWATIRMPKEIKNKTKSSKEAVQILNKIISSQKIMATCTEKIMGEITTNKFCCVCDIPFKDLIYHAPYYGEVAIGFSAQAIHKQFNPVLYKEREFPIPCNININDHTMLDTNKVFDDRDSFYDLISYLCGLDCNPEYKNYLDDHLGNMKEFIKITRFSDNDDETFYREREWRSINGDFDFAPGDVEAVIVPRAFISKVKSQLLSCDYKNDIAIIPFDLLEKV